MTAYNVVHLRVKPGCEDEFLALNRRPGHEVRSGLRNRMRHLLEDLGDGSRVTQAFSGTAVAETDAKSA